MSERRGDVVVVGLLIAALAFNAVYLLRSLTTALQPRALTYTEGVNAILATRPELWFHPVAQAPHFPTIYPLGYHALVNALTTTTGLNVYVVMHVVSLTAVFAGAVALYRLVDGPDVPWPAPLLAATLWLLSPAVSGVSVLGRVDHLGVALGLWALYMAQQRRLTGAVALTVASMYVKHSLVVFPIAIFCWWFLFEDERQALVYGAGVAGIGLGIFGILNVVTNGQAWTHLVEYNALHPWLWSVWSGQVVWFAYTHAIVASVLVYALLAGRVRPLPGTFAVVAILVALLTIGKVGSWVGYFLPVIAAGAWVFANLLPMHGVRWRPRVRYLVVSVVLVQLMLYGAWAENMAPKYDADAQAMALEDVRSAGGPILAEDGTLYTETEYGQVHEPLMMRFVYEYPSYEGDTLADEIQRQEYTRIVIGQHADRGGTSRWHEDELRAIDEHYVLAWEDGWYHVYVPRASETARSWPSVHTRHPQASRNHQAACARRAGVCGARQAGQVHGRVQVMGRSHRMRVTVTPIQAPAASNSSPRTQLTQTNRCRQPP